MRKKVKWILINIIIILTMIQIGTLTTNATSKVKKDTEGELVLTLKTKQDFEDFAQNVQAGNNYKGYTIYLDKDINLNNNEENQTITVGKVINYSNYKAFAGTFDGQGYTISGIYLNDIDKSYAALFPYNLGTIKNLTAQGYVRGYYYVGGIAAYSAGDIIACNNEISVIGKTHSIGGIVGYLKSGTVENSANYGMISSENQTGTSSSVGGIVGNSVAGSIVKSSYNAGTITIKDNGCAGGITGNGNPTVLYCYNKGTINAQQVTTSSKIAGISGVLGSNKGITNCYNIGIINTENKAGIAGFVQEGCVVSNSYYLESTGTYSYYIGGDSKKYVSDGSKSMDLMKTDSFVADLNNGSSVFCLDTKVNNGYPIFSWQLGNQSDVNMCKVRFLIDDTQEYRSFEVSQGGLVSQPETPSKAGYVFKYWSSSKEGDAFDFSTFIVSDTVLYAVWSKEVPLEEAWEYEFVNNATAVKLTKYKGSSESVTIPEKIQDLPVTELGNQTFKGNSTLQSIIFTDNILTVEDGYASTSTGITGAFVGCSSLCHIVFSKNMTKVADYMFYGAGSSKYAMNIDFANIKEIGMSAFSCCNNIVNLNLPTSVTKIGDSAFYQARRLATLTLPGVYDIAADAFTETIFEENYENLWKDGEFTGIVYAGSVAYMYMGDSNSKGMPDNTELVLKDNTMGISEFLFTNHYCDKKTCEKNLRVVYTSKNLKYIPEKLFNGFSKVTLYGEKASYVKKYTEQYENLEFKEMPEVACDYDWYDHPEKEKYYVIKNAAQLRGFEDIMNIGEDDFNGATIKLAADINLEGITKEGEGISFYRWEPCDEFAGTFDGAGHTISGLYINSSYDCTGFFGSISTKVNIKNLHIEGKIIGADYTGGIIGKSAAGQTVVDNCSFTGEIKAGNSYGYVGGIVGYAKQITISGCSVNGKISCNISDINSISMLGATGGIIGYNMGGLIITCVNNAAVKGNGYNIAGITGQNMPSSTVSNCINNGEVSGLQHVGAICGRNIMALINSCENSGKITGTSYTGGIVGTSIGIVTTDGKQSIIDSHNTGAITSTSYAGGILGYSEGSLVEKCWNSGNIEANTHVGGILAYNKGFGVLTSYNVGTIHAKTAYAGGIVGYDNGEEVVEDGEKQSKIVDSYNAGKITAASYASPIASVYQDIDISKNCYYLTQDNQTGMDKQAFTQGKVAYLLGDSYGQKIGKDDFPVFRDEGEKVLKVNFLDANNKELTTIFVNYGKSVSYKGKLPVKPCTDTKHYIFNKWNQEFSKVTKDLSIKPVFKDAKENAVWTLKKKAGTKNNGQKVKICPSCKKVIESQTIYAMKTITLSATSYTYNGTDKNPKVSLLDSKGKTVSSKNYTFSYSSNKNPGIATVTVKGKGEYEGTLKKTFTILPGQVQKLKASKITTKSLTLSWNKADKVTGYSVYQYNTAKKKWQLYKNVTKTSIEISKLSAGQSYKFKVQAYVKASIIYGKDSSVLTTNTKPDKAVISKLTTTKGKIKLQWKKIKGATGYQIYMTSKKNGTYKKIKETKELTYSKSKLTSGKTYYFQVRAYTKMANGTVLYGSFSKTGSKKVK